MSSTTKLPSPASSQRVSTYCQVEPCTVWSKRRSMTPPGWVMR